MPGGPAAILICTRKRYGWAVPGLLLAAVFFAILASLCIGAYPISFHRAAEIVLHLSWPFSAFRGPQADLKELTVVQLVRLPRVLLATLAGVGLGMAGTALQGMMSNPLVSPDVVGVTSGAAFGAVLAMLLELSATGTLALAFCGGICAMTCTFGLSKAVPAGSNSIVLLLAGVFVGSFFLALVGLVEFLAPGRSIFTMIYWLLGTCVGANWTKVVVIAIPTLLGGSILMFMRWRLNLLSLGELDARSIGVNVRWLRWTIIFLTSLIIASQVAVSGLLGWVGLIVPHCARMLVGPDHRRLFPTAALLGGLFVLGLDDLTRTIVRAEIPVGALTALIGTPVVCILLWKSRGKGWMRE